MNPETQIAYFRRCLVETVTWCQLTQLGLSVTGFRSEELNPEGNLDPEHDSFSLVESVCRRRAELLKERNAALLHDFEKAGQLLVFYPALSLYDGAAE